MAYIGKKPTDVPLSSADIGDEIIDSDAYVDGSIDNAHIADDAIDSEHYADGSIDNAHIADDAIDSEHYADGSIDNAHIADDAIDSEHYAAGSIDEAHIANDAINFATHLKAGTDGQIISWDASGDPVAVGPGSDGEVLTSTGAGSPPAFEAVGGGVTDCKFSLKLTSPSTNVTGNSTLWTAIGAIWTEVFDTGSHVVNGTFTAPETGKYLLVCNFHMNNCSGANLTYQQIVTSNRVYATESEPDAYDSNNALLSDPFHVIADMDGSDTAVIKWQVNGMGSDVADAASTSPGYTFFQGALLA